MCIVVFLKVIIISTIFIIIIIFFIRERVFYEISYSCVTSLKINCIGSEMTSEVEQVKAIGANSDDLRLVPGCHMVGRDNRLHQDSHMLNWAVVAHTFNLSPWEADAGKSLRV